MKLKTVLFDDVAIDRALSRIAHEVIEKNNGIEDIVFLGIKTGGVPVANTIRNKIALWEGVTLPLGELDITSYRDDLEEVPSSNHNNFNFDVKNKKVIICDDVIHTGRTVRAAIEGIIKLGRPKSIQLAVLVDRGHRELPIRADYVGKNVPTSVSEKILVNFDDEHNLLDISLYE